MQTSALTAENILLTSSKPVLVSKLNSRKVSVSDSFEVSKNPTTECPKLWAALMCLRPMRPTPQTTTFLFILQVCFSGLRLGLISSPVVQHAGTHYFARDWDYLIQVDKTCFAHVKVSPPIVFV